MEHTPVIAAKTSQSFAMLEAYCRDQGGPRLRAWTATLGFEEKFAGRKERNSIAINTLRAGLRYIRTLISV